MHKKEIGKVEIDGYSWKVFRHWNRNKGYIYDLIDIDGNDIRSSIQKVFNPNGDLAWYNQINVAFNTITSIRLTFLDQAAGYEEIKPHVRQLLKEELRAGTVKPKDISSVFERYSRSDLRFLRSRTEHTKRMAKNNKSRFDERYIEELLPCA